MCGVEMNTEGSGRATTCRDRLYIETGLSDRQAEAGDRERRTLLQVESGFSVSPRVPVLGAGCPVWQG